MVLVGVELETLVSEPDALVAGVSEFCASSQNNIKVLQKPSITFIYSNTEQYNLFSSNCTMHHAMGQI